jgi:hypothetical protein
MLVLLVSALKLDCSSRTHSTPSGVETFVAAATLPKFWLPLSFVS